MKRMRMGCRGAADDVGVYRSRSGVSRFSHRRRGGGVISRNLRNRHHSACDRQCLRGFRPAAAAATTTTPATAAAATIKRTISRRSVQGGDRR